MSIKPYLFCELRIWGNANISNISKISKNKGTEKKIGDRKLNGKRLQKTSLYFHDFNIENVNTVGVERILCVYKTKAERTVENFLAQSHIGTVQTMNFPHEVKKAMTKKWETLNIAEEKRGRFSKVLLVNACRTVKIYDCLVFVKYRRGEILSKESGLSSKNLCNMRHVITLEVSGNVVNNNRRKETTMSDQRTPVPMEWASDWPEGGGGKDHAGPTGNRKCACCLSFCEILDFVTWSFKPP